MIEGAKGDLNVPEAWKLLDVEKSAGELVPNQLWELPLDTERDGEMES